MDKQTCTQDNLLQSKVISFLRFPLIVAVVLIHTQIDQECIPLSLTQPMGDVFPIYETTRYIVAQILARVAVPLFFFFSGFLFFYKTKEFTTKVYGEKLKKRIHTLLIPYLFWNVAYLLFYNLGELVFGGADSFIGNGFSVKDWLSEFWGSNNNEYPLSFQFWFIRDLMVAVLMTPLIYWLIKKLNLAQPLILAVLWLIGWKNNVVGLSIDALLFFSFGAYFSITGKNFVNIVRSKATILGVLYAILVVLALYTKDVAWGAYISRISILVGAAFAISLSAVNIDRGKWKVDAFLTESSFFIFAYHVIALIVIRRVAFKIIPPVTDLRITLLFFLLAAVMVIFGLIIYRVFKKLLPKTTAFITGGR